MASNDDRAEEDEGTPCQVCGEPCVWGSRHVQCANKASDERAAVLDEYIHINGSGYVTVRKALAARDLHVVTAEQMRVLEAVAALPESTIRLNEHGRSLVGWPGSICNVWAAELARRESEK